MKIYGFIPARMASSRLPGKPLKFIQGRPMLEHVYERANFFNRWTKLSIATCDQEIKDFCKSKNYNSRKCFRFFMFNCYKKKKFF